MSSAIWTVGHSNRELAPFVELLTGAGITLIADVRRFPRSRKHPHFNREALAAALQEQGVDYRHFEQLGGRRSKRLPDSPNTAWRVEAFNAYADHMQSPEAQQALTELTALAEGKRTAILCAEAVPWRCHRRVIADALVARGWSVQHIIGPGQRRSHTLTEFSRVENQQVTYPGGSLFD